MSTELPRVCDAYVHADLEDSNRVVAGLPQLVRTLLVLQRAGVERCVIVGDVPAPRDPRISMVVVIDPEPLPPEGDDPTIVVGSDTVIDGALVDALRRSAVDETVVDVQRGRARARIAPARRALPMLPLATDAPPPGGTLLDADASGIETALVAALPNHRDGYVDRLLYRRLSRPVSGRLLPRGTSPNAVTIVGIALGVFGGVTLGLAGPAALVVGVGALVMSGVLDCVDGELARAAFAESRLGHVLDVTGDTVVHLALLTGIAMRLAGSGTEIATWVPWALGLGVLGSFAAITWSEVNEDRRHEVACWENRVLDGVLSPLTTRDWYVFPVAFAVAGRLDFLVVGAAVGAHVFWPVVVWLVSRVLRRVSVGNP